MAVLGTSFLVPPGATDTDVDVGMTDVDGCGHGSMVGVAL